MLGGNPRSVGKQSWCRAGWLRSKQKPHHSRRPAAELTSAKIDQKTRTRGKVTVHPQVDSSGVSIHLKSPTSTAPHPCPAWTHLPAAGSRRVPGVPTRCGGCPGMRPGPAGCSHVPAGPGTAASPRPASSGRHLDRSNRQKSFL